MIRCFNTIQNDGGGRKTKWRNKRVHHGLCLFFIYISLLWLDDGSVKPKEKRDVSIAMTLPISLFAFCFSPVSAAILCLFSLIT